MTDWDALLAQAQRPTLTVPLCLRGDLLAELDRMVKAGQNGSKLAAAKKAVKDACVDVRLRGLSFAEFEAVSRRFGGDTDSDPDGGSFAVELLRAALLDVPGDRIEQVLAALTVGQFNALAAKAMELTNTADPVPLPSGG